MTTTWVRRTVDSGLRGVKRRLATPPGSGRRWAQAFYRPAHVVALGGRGFGAGDWATSGERSVLTRLAEARPDIRTIVDVGANVGGWAAEAARTWPHATIHAFEPAGATFERLTEAVAGMTVRCVQSGVSDAAGTAQLHSGPGYSGLSSLHHRDLEGHGLEMTDLETIAVVTLDDYCQEQGIQHVDLLKVDAEGHDLAVLKGAQRMLDAGAIDFIQFEFGGANIDSRTFLRDFVRLLEPQYRLSRVLVDGLEPLAYSEREEIFVTANFWAERVRARG